MNENQAPRQLSLLPSAAVPVQCRLDTDTRRRGLRHVAEIRRQLADRQAARDEVAEITSRRPVRPEQSTAA